MIAWTCWRLVWKHFVSLWRHSAVVLGPLRIIWRRSSVCLGRFGIYRKRLRIIWTRLAEDWKRFA